MLRTLHNDVWNGRACEAIFLNDRVLSLPAYTELGGDEELPLGEEFQEHLKRFIRPNEKKVQKRIELVRKLVDQLAWVFVSNFNYVTKSN